MTWKVFLTPEAEKNLKKLPKNIQEKALNVLNELSRDPFFGKPLKWNLKGRFSARIGDYRIVYKQEIDNHRILVLFIRHRREAY